MDSVVITLQHNQEQIDLALPISVPLGQLAPILADKLTLNNLSTPSEDLVYTARVISSNNIIRAHETLEAVGVADGDILELIMTTEHTRFMPENNFERGRGAYLQSLDTDQKFRCLGRNTLIGRTRKNQINLARLPGSENVSRVHANILKRGNAYFIKDESSTNGTFIDGIELQPGESLQIRDGSRIQFGKDGPVLYFCTG